MAAQENLGQSPDLKSGMSSMKDAVGDVLDRGKSDLSSSLDGARNAISDDLVSLKSDLKRLQETFTRFATEAGGTAAGTVKDVSGAMTSTIGAAASEVAGNATQQVKTFASELESMARRNPLGTLAATLGIGIVIGMMGRGRS
jgi:ElaB/YqjD/DUF883 family membrane-anchored ribosome-binding protein